MYQGPSTRGEATSPIDRLVKVTYGMLLAVFALSFFTLLTMSALLLVVSANEQPLTAGGSDTDDFFLDRELPSSWAQIRLGMLGVAAIFIVAAGKLRGYLLRRDRLWMGATSLPDLGRMLEVKGTLKRGWGRPSGTPGAHPLLSLLWTRGRRPDSSAAADDPAQRQTALAAQFLVMRVVAAHVCALVFAQVLFMVGLADRMVTGDPLALLGALLAGGYVMATHRPSKETIRGFLSPAPGWNEDCGSRICDGSVV